ncbi:hypothetical protein GH714_040925 [Hevea brasiliensis]|uniref:PRONE domain-containing protein n=1 Tax=Hevea brasiliensis TaxID=3981 RepID=A0A6A6MVV1_HEVBR|nr:hypothetical protein GH714_040925 [Hevea brasiliensis]
MSDSSNDDNDLSFSSSKDAFGSFSSKWLTMKKDELSLDDWELSESPQHFYVKAKQPYTIQFSDVETMNEKFAKLLLVDVDIEADNDSKARADIHVNLPALQKLDSMLITLDSMVNTELWYSEVGSRAEGESKSKKQSKRWWPQVPKTGLSESDRKKCSIRVYWSIKSSRLLNLSTKIYCLKCLYQPLSGMHYQKFKTTEVKLSSLNLKSEHAALETINKLEAAIFAWKEKVAAQVSSKFPVRTSWSFMSEFDKIESLLDRAETLLRQVKARRFLEAKKIQYGRDVGHSTLEAYSRVLGNLALNILSRIWDICRKKLQAIKILQQCVASQE